MAKKATAKAVEPERIDPLALIDEQVSELETLRKSNPGSFYHAAARGNSPATTGPNRARSDELQARLKGFAARLERLR